MNRNTIPELRRMLDSISATLNHCGPDDGIALRLLAVRTQQLALEIRALYRQSEQESSAEEQRAQLREQGYTCHWQGGSVWIELPLLLPKRGGNAAFITRPLSDLLSLEIGRERFTEATIVCQQVYVSRNGPAAMRDTDNLEYRAVQNVLERYLLTSDSAYLCTTVHIGRIGVGEKTVLTVFPGKLDVRQIGEVLSHEAV